MFRPSLHFIYKRNYRRVPISCYSSSPVFLYRVRLLRIWYAEAGDEADEADEVGRKWVVKVRERERVLEG